MPEQSNELNSTPATILVVDDDEAIRKFVSAYLNSKGYHILTADSGEKALQISRTHDGPIDLLLSNIQMPGITGIELSTQINRERAQIRVMLMSGFDGGLLVLNEGWHFLHKPFMPSQLFGLVKTILSEKTMPYINEHHD